MMVSLCRKQIFTPGFLASLEPLNALVEAARFEDAFAWLHTAREHTADEATVTGYQTLLGELLLNHSQHPDKAALVLEQALQAAPKEARIRWSLAQAHWQNNQLGLAVELLKRLIEDVPPITDEASATEAHTYGKQAEECLHWLLAQFEASQQEWTSVVYHLVALLEVNPVHAEGLILLASTLQTLDRIPEAIAVLERLMAAFSPQSEGWQRASLQRNKLKKALLAAM